MNRDSEDFIELLTEAQPSLYAYVVSLTQEELKHLAKAEASLMMDVSDPDFECYVDLGYVEDVLVDWSTGKIYGLFDGTWPSLAAPEPIVRGGCTIDEDTSALLQRMKPARSFLSSVS